MQSKIQERFNVPKYYYVDKLFCYLVNTTANTTCTDTSVTSKKSPNVIKSCTKMISLEKFKILTPLQKLPKNVENLGKLIVAKGFEKMPKVQ